MAFTSWHIRGVHRYILLGPFAAVPFEVYFSKGQANGMRPLSPSKLNSPRKMYLPSQKGTNRADCPFRKGSKRTEQNVSVNTLIRHMVDRTDQRLSVSIFVLTICRAIWETDELLNLIFFTSVVLFLLLDYVHFQSARLYQLRLFEWGTGFECCFTLRYLRLYSNVQLYVLVFVCIIVLAVHFLILFVCAYRFYLEGVAFTSNA